MSLDIYIEIPESKRNYRECPHCDGKGKICNETYYFERNITHNLAKMANEAGLYNVLWRPQKNGYKTGADMIESIRAGLIRLKEDPERFKKFNASNGWGTYENLVDFAESVLKACEENPDGIPQTSC